MVRLSSTKAMDVRPSVLLEGKKAISTDWRGRSTCCCVALLQVIVVGSVLFVNQFGSLMLFPFLPFMVHDFFPHLSREELGQKAGFLGSAFFIGNFVGSFGWGWASDVFGRKPIMMLGLTFTIITELLFGFSQNFAWAVSARFLWGLLNGNLGVVKTYISEICDDSNQARGFSVIGVWSGIGRLTGSVVGGFLSQPGSKYSVFETAFFCKFPYVLPCLIGAVISFVTLIAAFIVLDETLHKSRGDDDSDDDGPGRDSEAKCSDDSGIDLSRQLQDEENEETVPSSTALADSGIELAKLPQDEEREGLLPPNTALVVMESDVDSESDGGGLSFDEDITSDTELLLKDSEETRGGTGEGRAWKIKQWSASWSPRVVMRGARTRAGHCRTRCVSCVTNCANCTPSQVGLFLVVKVKLLLRKLLEVGRLLVDRRVFFSTAIYGVYGGLQVMASETFPLLMVTCYHHGGYHLDGNELGVVIMCSGALQLVWQLLVYPHIAKHLGYRKTLQMGISIFIVCYMLLPFANRITGPVDTSPDGPCGNGTSADDLSGSRSGSGILDNATLDLNATDSNSTQYCTVDYEIGVNENSIVRVPLRVWALLLFVMTLLVMSRISGFISLFILIGNSSLPETRGSVNGISQSLVAIGRSVGPVVGSLLFAWSEQNGYGWPLDYHFVFNLVAGFGLLLVFLSFCLPKSIEKKRERPPVTSYS